MNEKLIKLRVDTFSIEKEAREIRVLQLQQLIKKENSEIRELSFMIRLLSDIMNFN